MDGIVLEDFVRKVVERARRGEKQEDAHVELKREWPTDYAKEARQLAAMCNAADSDWVLLIIGAHEDGSWREQAEPETSEWIAQLRKHFDQTMPTLLLDRKVAIGDQYVTVLKFDASYRPYVWVVSGKNAVAHGGVSLEVPWRSGASTVSARRQHLVSMLAPMVGKPTVELVGGYMMFYKRGEALTGHSMLGEMRLYFVPASPGRTVLPYHRMSVMLTSPSDQWTWYGSIDVARMANKFDRQGFVQSTEHEIIIEGPGSAVVRFGALGLFDVPGHIATIGVDLRYQLAGGGASHRIVVQYVQLGADMGSPRWTASHSGFVC